MYVLVMRGQRDEKCVIRITVKNYLTWVGNRSYFIVKSIITQIYSAYRKV